MRIFVVGLMMLGLAGCSFAPDYQRPQMELPQAWKDPGKGEQLDEQWWKRFDDSTLNALVQEALIANRDIAAAVARVDYARAQLGVARAELLPLLSGQAQGTQTWVDNTKITNGSQSPFSAGFGATWELDLWGKLRNAKEAAMYQVLGTEAAQRGMRLSIAAQTSNAYFLLRSLDLQLSTAERTVKTRTDALRIYTARYEQGLISELDLSRAKTEVETAKTALYQTRISRDAAESALEALLGRSPKDIMDGTVQRGMTLESIPTPPGHPGGRAFRSVGTPPGYPAGRDVRQERQRQHRRRQGRMVPGHFADRPLRRGQPRTAYPDEQSAPDVELRRSGFRAAA